MAELVNHPASRRITDSAAPARVLALGFWVWAGFVAITGGFFGAVLNTRCEGGRGEGCLSGFPSWFEPWTWGDYYVFPEVTPIAFGGLVVATVFVAAVFARRLWLCVIALLVSLVLLSYPYSAGLGGWRSIFGSGRSWP